MTATATLERARSALAAHAWTEAYDALSSLDADATLSAEDLERLGEAAWWCAHPAESIEAFERAYAAFLTEENPRRAARVALRLAIEYSDRAETALWHGWLQRAARLLAEDPDCVEQGYLEMALVRMAFEDGSIDDAERHATAGYEIGGRFDDKDLQALGLVLQGAILVWKTQKDRGFPMIDEGMLSAVGGELSPFTAGSIYCITISVCRSLADYRRAGEWTEAAKRWCERESITGFPGVCRVQRAEIMRLRGAFTQAEAEARAALSELTAFGRLPQAGAGAYELGEIRLRLGDLDGAEEAFAEAHRLGHEPQPGLALLWLARGRADSARASIRTALADVADPLDRARMLPATVEIALASHDLADAREAAEQLGQVASTFDSPVLHAAKHQALGAVLVYEEDPAAAIPELRESIRQWTEADAPFETAQARRSLGMAYRMSGAEDSALLELRAAKVVFDRLGATLEAERCETMLLAAEQRGAGRRVTRTFMFTDIVGSTDLVQQMGDEAWEGVLRWHDDALRTLIVAHRGEVVHTTGDGFFATFADPTTAASCAVAIQKRLEEHRAKNGFAPQVRIGLHTAEATVIANDYAGLGVHEAARVGAVASGDEILITTSSLDGGELPFGLSDEREVELKGLAEPVRVLSIEWAP